MSQDTEDTVWRLNLDELRRSSGISIDARGQWWHHGTRFTHQRTISQLNASLEWLSTEEHELSPIEFTSLELWQGEATITLGPQWCYIDCDVTPFLVLKLIPDPAMHQLQALLNNGETWPLGSLVNREDILFTWLAPHRLARFSSQAQLQCGEWLTEGENKQLMLRLGDQQWPIHDVHKPTSEVNLDIKH